MSYDEIASIEIIKSYHERLTDEYKNTLPKYILHCQKTSNSQNIFAILGQVSAF
jgi:hypothetical protein